MKNIKTLSLSAALLLLTACGGEKTAPEVDDSEHLYASTLELINTYSDSISAASDSTEVYRLFAAFNSRLDSLNNSVAPNTDLKLSENQNDTIFMNLMVLTGLFNGKLQAMSGTIEAPDSISTADTIHD